MEEAKRRKGYQYAVEYRREGGLPNTPIFRNARFPEALLSNLSDPVSSLFEAFERTCRHKPHAKCIGTQVLDAQGSKSYSWLSFAEWRACILRVSRLLVKLGIGTAANKFVAMVSSLSKEWLLLDMALIRICAVSVPFYRFLGASQIQAILLETEAEVLAGPSADLLNCAQAGLARVKTLLCLDSPTSSLLSFRHKFKIVDF